MRRPGPSAQAPQIIQQAGEPAPGEGAAEAGRDHEIGAAHFLGVGRLAGQDRIQPGRRHAGARQHPRALHEGGRRHDGHRVDAPLAAGFEQQRDVQHRHRHAAARAVRKETALGQPDEGMDDGFQAPQGRRVGEDAGAERPAVDTPPGHDAGKGGADGGDGGAARREEPVDRRVRIVDRRAQAPQHARRRRLAHADRSGQAQHDHAVPLIAPAPRRGRSAAARP